MCKEEMSQDVGSVGDCKFGTLPQDRTPSCNAEHLWSIYGDESMTVPEVVSE